MAQMIDRGGEKWIVSSFGVPKEGMSELVRSTDVLRFDRTSLDDDTTSAM
jgi:hypothetical protein